MFLKPKQKEPNMTYHNTLSVLYPNGETLGYDLKPIYDRWLKLLNTATAHDIVDAEEWYPRALSELSHHVAKYGKRKVACVVSALSPKMSWQRNVDLANIALSGVTTKPLGCMSKPWEKTQLCFTTPNPLALFKPGTKTEQFAKALSGDTDAIVIDTHMIHSSLGWQPSYSQISSAQFNHCTKALTPIVKWIADTKSMEPCTVQALIWILHKKGK